MTKDRNRLKWTPAIPIRKPDNIMSSKVRENGEKAFIPSYEKEPVEFMNFIMSNEYMRMWFNERNDYEREIYAKKAVQAEEASIKRRFVQRYMHQKKNKVKLLPPVTLKKYSGICERTQNKQTKK